MPEAVVSPPAVAAEPLPSAVPPPHLPPANLGPLTSADAFRAIQEAAEELADMNAKLVEKVTISEPNRITASFRAEHAFNKQSCERPEKKSRMLQTISRILGRQVMLDYDLLPAEVRPQQSNAAAGQAAGPTRPAEERRQRARAMEKHPLVKQAIELFDAEVLQYIEPKEVESPAREEA